MPRRSANPVMPTIPEDEATPVAPLPELPKLAAPELLKPFKLDPEKSPDSRVDGEWVSVNLKQLCIINGVRYEPGEGRLVPADAFGVWRHAV